MQKDVREVEIKGVAPTSYPIAQSKREYRQRSVGLVTRIQGYFGAPEVVSKYLCHGRRCWVDIPVINDRFAVVENEVSRAAIEVANESKACHQTAAEQPMP